MPLPKIDLNLLQRSPLYAPYHEYGTRSAIPSRAYEEVRFDGVVVVRRVVHDGDSLPHGLSQRELPKWIFPDVTPQESRKLLDSVCGQPMNVASIIQMTMTLCRLRVKIPTRYERIILRCTEALEAQPRML